MACIYIAQCHPPFPTQCGDPRYTPRAPRPRPHSDCSAKSSPRWSLPTQCRAHGAGLRVSRTVPASSAPPLRSRPDSMADWRARFLWRRSWRRSYGSKGRYLPGLEPRLMTVPREVYRFGMRLRIQTTRCHCYRRHPSYQPNRIGFEDESQGKFDPAENLIEEPLGLAPFPASAIIINELKGARTQICRYPLLYVWVTTLTCGALQSCHCHRQQAP